MLGNMLHGTHESIPRVGYKFDLVWRLRLLLGFHSIARTQIAPMPGGLFWQNRISPVH
jgi:hypothetical protein